MTKTPIVYLAGGINGLSDSECNDWRTEAKQLLVGFETLDPMRRDYRGREAECVNEIVHGDLIDIRKSNVVLAMCPRPSWGTAMEIYFARKKGKAVFTVVPPGPVSPWLTYHSKVCRSLEDAVGEIRDLLRTL